MYNRYNPQGYANMQKQLGASVPKLNNRNATAVSKEKQRRIAEMVEKTMQYPYSPTGYARQTTQKQPDYSNMSGFSNNFLLNLIGTFNLLAKRARGGIKPLSELTVQTVDELQDEECELPETMLVYDDNTTLYGKSTVFPLIANITEKGKTEVQYVTKSSAHWKVAEVVVNTSRKPYVRIEAYGLKIIIDAAGCWYSQDNIFIK